MTFETSDIRYIVDKNGQPLRIDNLKISPMGTYKLRDKDGNLTEEILTENFDFNSTDGIAAHANQLLYPMMDPSKIGKTVEIRFTKDVQPISITKAEFDADLNNQDYKDLRKKHNDNFFKKYNPFQYDQDKYIEELQNIRKSHVFDFLTTDEKPVVFGSNEDDTIKGLKAPNNDMSKAELGKLIIEWVLDDRLEKNYIHDYVKNGIVYVLGKGKDTASGTEYDDILIGGEVTQGNIEKDPSKSISNNTDISNDSLEGRDGNDHIYGGAGDDTIYGDHQGTLGSSKGKGNDILFGDNGKDKLYGGAGDDKLYGGSGEDTLDGGSGFDTYDIEGQDRVIDVDMKGRIVIGGMDLSFGVFEYEDASTWRLNSAKGDIVAHKQGDDLVVELGHDRAEISHFFAKATQEDGLWTGLGMILMPAGETADRLNPYKYAQVYGSNDEDRLIGSSKGDRFLLSWAEQKSVIFAQEGNDLIIGGPNADQFDGGTGNDVIMGAPRFHNQRPADEMVADKDIIVGGAGHDLLMGVGGDDIIYADYKTNMTAPSRSGEQGDWLLGNAGHDTLYGAARDDFLQGGSGSDVIDGGGGDDVILGDGEVMFEFRSQTYIDTGTDEPPHYTPTKPLHPLLPPGVDVTYPGSSTAVHSYEYHKVDGVWEVKGLSNIRSFHPDTFEWTLTIDRDKGDYHISTKVPIREHTHRVAIGGSHDELHGGAGDDLILGQDGDDVLYGDEGHDILWGDDNRDLSIEGNDTLNGGDGDDILYGGGGDDKLYGGRGNDTLIGGHGADQYYFERSDFIADDHNIVIDDGVDDLIYLDGQLLANFEWQADDTQADVWRESSGYWLQTSGDTLLMGFGVGHSVTVKDYAQGDFGLNLTRNHAPEVAALLEPLTAKAHRDFTYQLSKDLFVDADGDDLSYRIEGLPEGLAFDAATRTLSGQMRDAGTLNLTLIASDPSGATAKQPLLIHVVAINHAPEMATPLHEQTLMLRAPWQWQIPQNAVIDPDGDTLHYQLGSDAPAWLSLNHGVLSGTAPSLEAVHTTIDVSDADGATVTLDLNLSIQAPSDAIVKSGIVFGTLSDNVIYGGSDNDSIRGLAGHDALYGWEGDDVIDGGLDDDHLFGGDGDDTLIGGLGNDTVTGGLGNDQLKGGLGDDVYIFKAGDGHERIFDMGGDDRLVLQDIRTNDVLVQKAQKNLIISFGNAEDSITLEGFYGLLGNATIETIQLADTTLTHQQLSQYGDGQIHSLNHWHHEHESSAII